VFDPRLDGCMCNHSFFLEQKVVVVLTFHFRKKNDFSVEKSELLRTEIWVSEEKAELDEVWWNSCKIFKKPKKLAF